MSAAMVNPAALTDASDAPDSWSTVSTVPPVSTLPTWAIGAPRLLAGLDRFDRLEHRRHLEIHGPLPIADLDRLIAQLDAVAVSGRGGAGFPLAAKIRALRGARRTVIVNGSESEPASRKDRTLLLRAPHLVLDGALALATVLGARQICVAVHDPVTAVAVRTALAERRDAGTVRVQQVGGGFVGGEARSLVRALAGGPPRPPGRREHATDSGRLVVNTETAAQVAVLLRMGWRRYADTGTRTEPGTTLLTIGGAVGRPGVVEIPLGTPLGIVLAATRAHELQAIVIGGYHGSWLAPLPAIELSRAGVARAGGTLGAGVLLGIGQQTCSLGELARVTSWLAGESARQCGPCMFGLPALARDVEALRQGHPSAAEIAFRHARSVDGRGACSHPDGTARFVTSALHLLQDETYRHLHDGCGRPTQGHLPIGAGR